MQENQNNVNFERHKERMSQLVALVIALREENHALKTAMTNSLKALEANGRWLKKTREARQEAEKAVGL